MIGGKNLLENVKIIRKLSEEQIENFSVEELKSLVQVSQKAFEHFSPSSHWDKIEHKILNDEVKRKKKLLSKYEDLFSKLNLNPSVITPEKTLFENVNNFQVKQFFEAQNCKILMQQFKLNQNQIRKAPRIKKSWSTASFSSASTVSNFEQNSKNFVEKLKKIMKKPGNLVGICENFENFSHFCHREKDFEDTKKKIKSEIEKKCGNLVEKYGPNIVEHVIQKRSKWDQEYVSKFRENEKKLKKSFGHSEIKRNLSRYFKKSENRGFAEGKTVNTVMFNQELIKVSQVPRPGKEIEISCYCEDTIEVSLTWD